MCIRDRSGLVFVIEAVAARLQFARLHASVPPFRDNGRSRIEQLAADPPQMEAPLVAWRPAEKRGRHTQPSHMPVFADTDTVAVSVSANTCLLYTSDAAEALLCVDIGGRPYT